MPYFKMTKLALKWAFRKPVTTRYPFKPRKPLDGSRGELVFTQDSCIYCTICAKKCPTGAILVDRVAKTWAIERLQCISCASCVEACPKDSLELSTNHAAPATAKQLETHAAPPAPPTPPAPVTAAAPSPPAEPVATPA